jgi:hypothetical protein
MLPDHELDTFLMRVTEAVDLARAGDVADGYTALLAGLHRAREMADAGRAVGGGTGVSVPRGGRELRAGVAYRPRVINGLPGRFHLRTHRVTTWCGRSKGAL